MLIKKSNRHGVEAAPHSHSPVGIRGALIFSWAVSRSVGQRPQRRGEAHLGKSSSHHIPDDATLLRGTAVAAVPSARVTSVDMVKKVIDNLIRCLFWVNFCLLIHPQWRWMYQRKELLASSFLPFFPPRAGTFEVLGLCFTMPTLQQIFILSRS